MRSPVSALRRGLGATGAAAPGAGGARPKPGPGPVSHPSCWKERCYFGFSFSAFLTSWGLSEAGLPHFHLSPVERPRGAERCPPPPGCPFTAMCPLQCRHLAATCPCADDVPTAAAVSPCSDVPPCRDRSHPTSSLPFTPVPTGPPSLRDSHAGVDVGQRGGLKGGWHGGCQQPHALAGTVGQASARGQRPAP